MKKEKEILECVVFLGCFYLAGNLIAFIAALITVIFFQNDIVN